MQACDQYPLAVGDWQLYYTVAAGAPMPVHIDPNLTVPGTRYGGLFSAPNYRYWVLPTDAPDSDAFCLAVNYRAIPRADIDPTKATTGLQRTIRNMRNRTYVAIYNTFAGWCARTAVVSCSLRILARSCPGISNTSTSG